MAQVGWSTEVTETGLLHWIRKHINLINLDRERRDRVTVELTQGGPQNTTLQTEPWELGENEAIVMGSGRVVDGQHAG